MHNIISFKVIKIKEYLIYFILISLFILLLIFSNYSFNAAKNGTELFLYNILPSLFPFLVLSNILINTDLIYILNKLFSPICQKLFRLPGIASLPIFIGFISGYPLGAKATSELYKKGLLTKNQANSLLSFTNNAGPTFIISFIGISLYKDIKTGLLLLFIHIISSIITGMIICRFSNSREISLENYIKKENNNITSLLVNSIKDSINTIILIGGFVVFFSVVIELLNKCYFFELFLIPINKFLYLFNIDNYPLLPIFQGFVEMTNGINNLHSLQFTPYFYKVCVTSFLLGIGGLSIYMQLCSIISDTDLSTKRYIIGKIIQSFISIFLSYIIIRYTPFFNLGSIETYVKPYTNVNIIMNNEKLGIFIDIITVCFIFIVLYKVKQIQNFSKQKKYKI